MRKVLTQLFIFFCFFPFIGFNIGTDMQPFALLFAVMILFFDRKIVIVNKRQWIPFIASLMIFIFISMMLVPLEEVIRRLFSYVSLILIYFVSVDIFSNNGFDFEKYSKIYNCLWTIVGTIQLVWDREFLIFLVPLSRTSIDRGVTSLGSEPAFYGYMCFFFFIFALQYKTNKYLFCGMAFMQTLLIAQSSVTLLYFVVFVVVYSIYQIVKIRPKQLLFIVLVMIAVSVVLQYLIINYKETRMVQLILQMLDNPMDVFVHDASANDRLNSIILSFSKMGIPAFIGSSRFHSGFGSAFYELGIFSLLLFIPIWRSIYHGYSDHILGKTLVVTITICMLSCIQLSLPLAALYYGLCEARNRKRKVASSYE